jgi:hypothetical protein
MFKNYNEFLNESKEDDLVLAEKIAAEDKFKSVSDKCEEGMHPHISITAVHDAKSYVAVALNDGSPISEVYSTKDPMVALIAIIIKNTSRKKSDEILSIIETNDSLLAYSIFPGDQKMTDDQIANRFNFSKPENNVPFYTSTPVIKIY